MRDGVRVLAHGAVEVHELVLVVPQACLDLEDLQIDLVREHLGVPPEALELRLSRHHHRLQADLERLRVRLELHGEGVELGPELLVGVLGHPRAEVGRVGNPIIVLQVLLLQDIDASSMIGKRFCHIAVMGFLLLTDAAHDIRKLLEARQWPERSVIAVTEPLSLAGLVGLWPRGCSRCSRVRTGSSGRPGSNARRRPRNTRL